MELIKKIFPLSFTEKKTIGALILNVLIQLIVCAIAGVLIGIFAQLPIVGIIVGFVGGFVGLYELIGILLSILDYAKVLKESYILKSKISSQIKTAYLFGVILLTEYHASSIRLWRAILLCSDIRFASFRANRISLKL